MNKILSYSSSIKLLIIQGTILAIFLEVSKFITFKLGHLPRYLDVPLLASFFISTVTIILYYLSLFYVFTLLKKIKN
jgi:hypothetical protein